MDGRLRLFRHYLRGVLPNDAVLLELSAKFRFEPGQIRRASEFAANTALMSGGAIDSAILHHACYRQTTHSLDRLATRLTPRYTWEDIMLPPAQKKLLQHACAHVKHRHRVYEQWGFGQKISYGTGLSILFSGAPGTGKTLCAQIIAGELNMEAYKVNISQIVSKYIGETEKNLHALFKEAKKSNCILFFDECDAIFGKRSDVKDSHDRNANIEVSYLLQQIEEHDGVCLLASNLIQNIDAAFMRRITYVVHFPFPDAKTRREIYLHLLPPGLPIADDIDWDYVAGKFELSGGHIKNIVLSAAFMAAGENAPFCMRHLLTAAVGELRKNDIVVVREDFREYADWIFEQTT
jgi:SpoVK/Ycf46/Vps4 family AAA+-type ATPase